MPFFKEVSLDSNLKKAKIDDVFRLINAILNVSFSTRNQELIAMRSIQNWLTFVLLRFRSCIPDQFFAEQNAAPAEDMVGLRSLPEILKTSFSDLIFRARYSSNYYLISYGGNFNISSYVKFVSRIE